MLSFFRKKSMEESHHSTDQTVPTTSSRNNSICDNMQFRDSDELVRALGYNNLTELKETIYGKRKIPYQVHFVAFSIVIRYVENDQRSREAINVRRLECCLRGGNIYSKTN